MRWLPPGDHEREPNCLLGRVLFQVRKPILDRWHSNIQTTNDSLILPITRISSASPLRELFQETRFHYFRMSAGTLLGLFNLRSEGFPNSIHMGKKSGFHSGQPGF